MSCQSTFVSPITIPTGLTGAAGPAGSAGGAVYENTIATEYTSASTGDQVLKEYTLTGGVSGVGDVLEIEGIFRFANTFFGEIYLKFGSTTIGSYTVLDTDILPVSTYIHVSLKATIYVKTASTQIFTKETEVFGSNVVKSKYGSQSAAVNTANDIIISAGCVPTAGAVTLLPLTVILNKKV